MTEPKRQRNTTGPLPPATCADRIAKILADAPIRIAKKEAEVIGLKAAIAKEVHELFKRCTAAEKLPALLEALDVDTHAAVTGGYWSSETVVTPSAQPDPTAEEPSASDDGIPERLKAEVPPADRIEIDRSTGESRRVGAGRKG